MQAARSENDDRHWQFFLLGQFEGVRGGTRLPKLRSRTSKALLAFLALNPGREFSRFELAEMFWPDSDGDRQHQNLRRCLTDLRQALEDESERGDILAGKRDFVSLGADHVTTDVARFRSFLDQRHLAEAIAAYRGPLLPGYFDSCFSSLRLQLEESFAQGVATHCRALCKTDAREAAAVGRIAVVAAPLREDIHLSLIESYISAGLPSEALRQFEELERILDETFGERPSERALALLDSLPRGPRTQRSPSLSSDTESTVVVICAHEDRERALDLVSELRKAGSASVLDEADLPSKRWRIAMEQRFCRAKAIAVLDSPSANTDEFLGTKVELALQLEASNGPRVLAVRFPGASPLLRDRRGIVEWFDGIGPQEIANAIRLAAESDVPLRPELELSGGAVPLDSKYYVMRDVDLQMTNALARNEGVILVQGPRQIGKTSLLARGLNWARHHLANQGDSAAAHTALCDFQSISASQFGDHDRFYRSLAHRLAKDLDCSDDWKESWSEWLGPNDNLEEAVERILSTSQGKVVWGFDEVDRIFGQSYSDDFFGLLRGWYNRRSLEPDGPWTRLTFVITYATEAHLFIADLNQSPFNIGVRLEPQDFTVEQIAKLAEQYALSLDEPELELLHELVGGHPLLVRRALDWLALTNESPIKLEQLAASEHGPFADHLRRVAALIGSDVVLSTELLALLRENKAPSPASAHRLASAGILERGAGLRFRSPLYRQYLASTLQ